MHPTSLIPYPRFIKIIVDHIITEHSDIAKRINEPYQKVENDEVVKSIFNSRKRKGRGMRIPEWLLTEEIKQTKNYKRKQPDPTNPILTTDQIDVDSLDEATQVSIAIARSVKEYEAQRAIKKVDKYLIDEDIEKLVEGDETDADKFADDMMNSQEDPGTWIEPESHKEISKMEKVANYMSIDEELEEESAEDALISKKGMCIVETKDTPITTPTRSPRTINDSLSSDKEKL
ncbi:hypothetical protein Tco_1228961 [Tanacetum coccineum]